MSYFILLIYIASSKFKSEKKGDYSVITANC